MASTPPADADPSNRVEVLQPAFPNELVDDRSPTDAPKAILSRPQPKYAVGDMITKQVLKYEHDSEWGYSKEEYDVVFSVQFRHYDEQSGDWYYVGRPTQGVANHIGIPFGVWAWEWETRAPTFSRGEAVEVNLDFQKVVAQVKSWKPLRDGVYYDLDVGVTQFPQSDVQDVSEDDFADDSEDDRCENPPDGLKVKRAGYDISYSPLWQETSSDRIVSGVKARLLNISEEMLSRVNAKLTTCKQQRQTANSQLMLSVSSETTPDLPIPRPSSSDPTSNSASIETRPMRMYQDGDLACCSFSKGFADGSCHGFVRIISGHFDDTRRAWFYCFTGLWPTRRYSSHEDVWLALDDDRQILSGPGAFFSHDACTMIQGSWESSFKQSPLHAGDEGTVFFRDRDDARCMIRQSNIKIKDPSMGPFNIHELVTADGQVETFYDNYILAGGEEFDKATGDINVAGEDTRHPWFSWAHGSRRSGGMGLRFAVKIDGKSEHDSD